MVYHINKIKENYVIKSMGIKKKAFDTIQPLFIIKPLKLGIEVISLILLNVYQEKLLIQQTSGLMVKHGYIFLCNQERSSNACYQRFYSTLPWSF